MQQDVTLILTAAANGDANAAERLLPLVYDELRRLAGALLQHERAGQTLQATALVHEAYLRLVGGGEPSDWQNRRHFFGAAAESMRRILIEVARRKSRFKHGGEFTRVELADVPDAAPDFREDLEALSAALLTLKGVEPDAAELVQLRYFAGLTMAESAELLGMSERSAARLWNYAKAWLLHEIGHSNESRPPAAG